MNATCTAAGCSTRTGHVCQRDPDRALDLAALRCYRAALESEIATLRQLGAEDAADLVLARWHRVCERVAAVEGQS